MWNLPQTNAETEFTSPRKNSRRFCRFTLQNLWQEIFNYRWKESTRKNSHCRQTIRVFILWKGVCPKGKHAGNGLFLCFLLWIDLNNICCPSLNVKSKAFFYLFTRRILCTCYDNTVNRAAMQHMLYCSDNFNCLTKLAMTFKSRIYAPFIYICIKFIKRLWQTYTYAYLFIHCHYF